MNYQEALPPVLVVEAEPRSLHSQPEAGNEQNNHSPLKRTLAISQAIDSLADVAVTTHAGAAVATLTPSQRLGNNF